MSAEVNIAGKDYFTEEEAAHYACVSESQFRAKREEYGLLGFWWMGKKVYRKADIQQAMEREWQRSPSGVVTGNSIGRTRRPARDGKNHSGRSAQSPSGTPKPASEPRNTNSPQGQDSSTRTAALHQVSSPS